MSKLGVASGAYFRVLELNTVIYGLNLRIQSKYGKIRTRKTPYLDTFYAVKHSAIKSLLFALRLMLLE